MTSSKPASSSKRDRLRGWWKSRKSQPSSSGQSSPWTGLSSSPEFQPPVTAFAGTFNQPVDAASHPSAQFDPLLLQPQSTAALHPTASCQPWSPLHTNALPHLTAPLQPFSSPVQQITQFHPTATRQPSAPHQSVSLLHVAAPTLPLAPRPPITPIRKIGAGRSSGQPEGTVVHRSYLDMQVQLRPTIRPGFANDRARRQLAKNRLARDRERIKENLSRPKRRTKLLNLMNGPILDRIVELLDFSSVVCLRASSKWLRKAIVLPRTAPTLDDTRVLRSIFHSQNHVPGKDHIEGPDLEYTQGADLLNAKESSRGTVRSQSSNVVGKIAEHSAELKCKEKRKRKKKNKEYELSFGPRKPRTCWFCLGVVNGVGKPDEWCRCRETI